MAERTNGHVSASIELARDSFGTYQRAQERAVAYTVLAHKSILTRSVHFTVRFGRVPISTFALFACRCVHVLARQVTKASQRSSDCRCK